MEKILELNAGGMVEQFQHISCSQNHVANHLVS